MSVAYVDARTRLRCVHTCKCNRNCMSLVVRLEYAKCKQASYTIMLFVDVALYLSVHRAVACMGISLNRLH